MEGTSIRPDLTTLTLHTSFKVVGAKQKFSPSKQADRFCPPLPGFFSKVAYKGDGSNRSFLPLKVLVKPISMDGVFPKPYMKVGIFFP